MTIKVSILIILMSLSFWSCEETDVGPEAPNEAATIPDSGAILGNWTVYRYMDDNDNETSYFSNIIFQFTESGDFNLIRNSQVLASGDWQLRDNNRELDINVPALAGENDRLGEELYEIHDDWDISMDENGRIILRDDDEEFILQPQSN